MAKLSKSYETRYPLPRTYFARHVEKTAFPRQTVCIDREEWHESAEIHSHALTHEEKRQFREGDSFLRPFPT